MPTSRLTCDEKIIPLDAQAGSEKTQDWHAAPRVFGHGLPDANLKDGEEEMVAKAANLRGPARQRFDSKC
jgi:hypothetical protein